MHTRRALTLLLTLVGSTLSVALGAEPVVVSTEARAIQPGELVVVTLSVSEVAEAVTVTTFGRATTAFRLGDRTWRALIGVDLEQRPGTYELLVEARLPQSSLRAARDIVVRPKRFPERHLRVDPRFVEPSPEQMAQIRADARFLQDAYASPAPERLWREPFTRPVPGIASGLFGSRSIFNGRPRAPHSGADFQAVAGTPIKAPNAGLIVAARDLYFTGNTVIIDHGLGLFSVLAHLSRLDVREGDAVRNGEVVGLVGATGRVTGPHLHWGLRVSGARVDPLSVLALLAAPGASPDQHRDR